MGHLIIDKITLTYNLEISILHLKLLLVVISI
jgi:hypothetical protein